MKEKELRPLRPRAIFLLWAIFAIAAGLIVRLFVIQVRDSSSLAAIAADEQKSYIDLLGARGDIVDRFGVPFAVDIPASAIAAKPARIKNPAAAARALAPLLRQTPQALEAALRGKASFVYLAREVPKGIATKIDQLAIPGISTRPEPTGAEVSPQGPVASTVIGFTGDDNQGLSGIEFAFDAQLAGKKGEIIENTDSAGSPIPFGRRLVVPARAGDTIILTLDRTLQYAADRVLQQTVRAHDAAGGSVVIMRASTGEILALANYPNFDPNHYTAYPEAAWRDRAITDPYEPGSTFKLVTATAALDSGKVTLDDTFRATNRIEVGGYTIWNADDGLLASGRSVETLDDIVTFSHNVGAAQVAMRIGKQTMYEYIRRFGFDNPTGVDLPGESAGIVGTPDSWWGSRLATIGFGQGISVTPLQLARAYCTVANGGLLMRPLIVREVIDAAGHVVKRYQPQVVDRVMRPETSAKLLAILRDVVKRGTGESAKIPGYAIAGKTGTAQIVVDGEYVPGAYTASFIGVVPADRPQYVILVKIDQPRGAYYGGLVAAPAFKELATRLFWREGIMPRFAARAKGRRTIFDIAPSPGEAPATALQGNAPSPW